MPSGINVFTVNSELVDVLLQTIKSVSVESKDTEEKPLTYAQYQYLQNTDFIAGLFPEGELSADYQKFVESNPLILLHLLRADENCRPDPQLIFSKNRKLSSILLHALPEEEKLSEKDFDRLGMANITALFNTSSSINPTVKKIVLRSPDFVLKLFRSVHEAFNPFKQNSDFYQVVCANVENLTTEDIAKLLETNDAKGLRLIGQNHKLVIKFLNSTDCKETHLVNIKSYLLLLLENYEELSQLNDQGLLHLLHCKNNLVRAAFIEASNSDSLYKKVAAIRDLSVDDLPVLLSCKKVADETHIRCETDFKLLIQILEMDNISHEQIEDLSVAIAAFTKKGITIDNLAELKLSDKVIALLIEHYPSNFNSACKRIPALEERRKDILNRQKQGEQKTVPQSRVPVSPFQPLVSPARVATPPQTPPSQAPSFVSPVPVETPALTVVAERTPPRPNSPAAIVAALTPPAQTAITSLTIPVATMVSNNYSALAGPPAPPLAPPAPSQVPPPAAEVFTIPSAPVPPLAPIAPPASVVAPRAFLATINSGGFKLNKVEEKEGEKSAVNRDGLLGDIKAGAKNGFKLKSAHARTLSAPKKRKKAAPSDMMSALTRKLAQRNASMSGNAVISQVALSQDTWDTDDAPSEGQNCGAAAAAASKKSFPRKSPG